MGLTGVQPGGIALHLSRGKSKVVDLNIALLAAAVITIWLAMIWL